MKNSVLVVTLLLYAVSASGTMYSWVDDQGTISFTEDYGCIPKKFRKKAKVVGEDEPETVEPAEPVHQKSKPLDEVKLEVKEKAAVERREVQYGGKDASVWKGEFGKLNADLKTAEDQVVQLRGRLADTSKMSRTEYLSIQMSLKNVETRVLELRKKRDELVAAANKAMLPEDCR